MDIEISDDIECFRLFRNNYYVYVDFVLVFDKEFEDVWGNLKLVIKWIVCNLNIMCNMDYEKEFREIECLKCIEY